MNTDNYEDALPDPEFLIKSIAEQGYSLETALADLIDNSIAASARKAEILIDTTSEPFMLFLADDGYGMDLIQLKQAMKFPSSSPEDQRKADDLGRFGLGLKTASFSQTRHFTVLSRKKGQKAYSGRSWNVEVLQKKQWKIVVESEAEINRLVDKYQKLSSGFLNGYDDFQPNTIVIWRGLHKFESYLNEAERGTELKRQITQTTTKYLSLVFHRFLESSVRQLSIRINNSQISGFNPFPSSQPDFRKLEPVRKQFKSDNLRIEGYVLPARSLDESKIEGSVWVQQDRSLTDMEGLYIYRGERIILHGGWNGLIKRNPRLQLARLRINIGNSVDHLFHLNVAKSSINIPPDLRIAFIRYLSELKTEAEREYYNRGIRKISVAREKPLASLFVRTPSDRGMLLEINNDFPIVKILLKEVTAEQRKGLSVLFQMINTTVNKIRQVHSDKDVSTIINDTLDINQILYTIEQLKKNGVSVADIKTHFIDSLGISFTSLPPKILKALNE